MKLHNMVSFVLLAMLVALLVTATTASMSALDQTRPNTIYRDTSQYYINHLVKGNTTESDLELVLNSASYGIDRYTVRGDPAINQSEDSISIDGVILATKLDGRLQVLSGYQQDNYLPNQPVGERFKVVPVRQSDTNSRLVDIDRSFDVRFSYDSLLTNDNFTQITREDLDATAFVDKNVNFRSATLNNSEGQPVVNVIGFAVTLRIVIYQTSTEKLIGVYSGSTRGYGNIFPTDVRTYLLNHNLTNEIREGTEGLEQLRGDRLVSWYYHGYNSSLQLDIYRAQFEMRRDASWLLFTPQSSSLYSTQSVSTGVESFMNDLEEENALSFEQDSVEEYDDNLVSEAIELNGVDISTIPSSTTTGELSSGATLQLNTSMMIMGQFLVLIALGSVLFRRFR